MDCCRANGTFQHVYTTPKRRELHPVCMRPVLAPPAQGAQRPLAQSGAETAARGGVLAGQSEAKRTPAVGVPGAGEVG